MKSEGQPESTSSSTVTSYGEVIHSGHFLSPSFDPETGGGDTKWYSTAFRNPGPAPVPRASDVFSHSGSINHPGSTEGPSGQNRPGSTGSHSGSIKVEPRFTEGHQDEISNHPGATESHPGLSHPPPKSPDQSSVSHTPPPKTGISRLTAGAKSVVTAIKFLPKKNTSLRPTNDDTGEIGRPQKLRKPRPNDDQVPHTGEVRRPGKLRKPRRPTPTQANDDQEPHRPRKLKKPRPATHGPAQV